jgi:hypothetical protein
VLRYKEFTGRHGRRGIDFVSLSSGSSLITGCGAKPNTRITYKEFQKDPRFIKRT